MGARRDIVGTHRNARAGRLAVVLLLAVVLALVANATPDDTVRDELVAGRKWGQSASLPVPRAGPDA
jgi:hypothetical protein